MFLDDKKRIAIIHDSKSSLGVCSMMRYFTLGLAILPLLTTDLFSVPPQALPIPKNPVIVKKEASPYPALHEIRVRKRERKYLKRIFKETKEASRQGFNVDGVHIELDKNVIKQMQRHTHVIHHPHKIQKGQHKFSTQILVSRREVMAAARFYANQGIPTAVLNMAHENRPGDSVFWGKETEEAAIFRVTDYFLSLFPHLNPTLKKQLHSGKYHVPEFGGIYSPHVFVFRENQEVNFHFLAKPLQVNMIASVPYNMCHHSSQHSSPGSRGKYVHGTKEKIRAILRIAAHFGNTAVILSDYGCTERHNHPKIVAKLFKEVLKESEFHGVFRVVDFAIPGTITRQVFLDFSRNLNGLVQ
jgi:uncharacterized protein (TIGR02452 family)